MGMTPLRSAVLPAGEREVRIEIICDRCTPGYLFRIRTGPGRRLQGEAYVLQAHFTPETEDSADVRIIREYDAATAAQRAALRCGPPVRSADTFNDSCAIGLPIDWSAVVAMLDRSGILRTVVDSGYGPRPPGFRSFATRDSVTGRLRIGSDTEGPGCRDLGGESLIVEVLDGPKYGTASFWCLETRGPAGAEHDRVAGVRAALLALVPSPDRP